MGSTYIHIFNIHTYTLERDIYIPLLKFLAVTFESQISFMVYLANNSQESIRSSNFHASFPNYIYLKQFCLLIGQRATCQARKCCDYNNYLCV